jgi:FKBP-type peptidyl-prolyl cis-trans isomerase FkpA
VPSAPALAVLVSILLALAPVPRAAADDVSPPPRRFTRVPAPDGIQIRRYNRTDGASPGKDDRVVVHYHGTLDDGTVFDSTRRSGRPAPFHLEKVIDCWKVALPRLRVGERAQVVCPSEVAYGPKGSPPRIPGGARLTFEIELVGIQ